MSHPEEVIILRNLECVEIDESHQFVPKKEPITFHETQQKEK